MDLPEGLTLSEVSVQREEWDQPSCRRTTSAPICFVQTTDFSSVHLQKPLCAGVKKYHPCQTADAHRPTFGMCKMSKAAQPSHDLPLAQIKHLFYYGDRYWCQLKASEERWFLYDKAYFAC